MGKKIIPDTPWNCKLQSKKAEWKQQLPHFLDIRENAAVLMILWKFLSENIILPVIADGSVIGNWCWFYQHKYWSKSHHACHRARIVLSPKVIFFLHQTKSYNGLIDNDNLSFNEKWNSLANCYMNAELLGLIMSGLIMINAFTRLILIYHLKILGQVKSYASISTLSRQSLR